MTINETVCLQKITSSDTLTQVIKIPNIQSRKWPRCSLENTSSLVRRWANIKTDPNPQISSKWFLFFFFFFFTVFNVMKWSQWRPGREQIKLKRDFWEKWPYGPDQSITIWLIWQAVGAQSAIIRIWTRHTQVCNSVFVRTFGDGFTRRYPAWSHQTASDSTHFSHFVCSQSSTQQSGVHFLRETKSVKVKLRHVLN